ncbi:MAG: hypothetical protein AUK47_21295 [Deltaproteobacteria bacterium CG2_30_63_29]|nr:MAG: hypothetical protein AUK47_21295 [Deltaproteobacteria bacterium CG2_30_63_29]PJB35246.1 MAG: hypothetical protein CO108_26200 [Deltaproteobacteria bacterium CG_4_9_14_3_um_filter_63_12]
MSSTPALTAVQPWTHHYEALRSEALGARRSASGRGLALFIRGGTVAWMAAWSSLVTARPSAERPQPASAPFPSQDALVEVLATMAMSNAMEVNA